MAFGKMSEFIKIVAVIPQKDSAGFATKTDTILAEIRAYVETRHGSKGWANRAAFTNATALFRFRKIPGVEVNTTHTILWKEERYKAVSVEDVRNRGMYTEILAEVVEGSMR